MQTDAIVIFSLSLDDVSAVRLCCACGTLLATAAQFAAQRVNHQVGDIDEFFAVVDGGLRRPARCSARRRCRRSTSASIAASGGTGRDDPSLP